MLNKNSIKRALLYITLISSAISVFNSKPIIGILTNPIQDDTDNITESFINQNYLKWIEAAGAEAIPIHPWLSDQELNSILSKVNGVLFQGGSTSPRLDSPFVISATKILKRVIKEKDENNRILPLWGTCQGFELIHVIVSGSRSVLENYNSFNTLSSLQINSDANKTTKTFSLFSDKDIVNLKAQALTAEYHNFGVSLEDYTIFPDLEAFMLQTSFAFDNDGKIYVASAEARKYPIYAVQFHPEKTSYDRNSGDSIPQGIDAVRVSHNFANFFVNVARSNDNKMSADDLKFYGLINSFEAQTVKKEEYNIYLFKRPSVIKQSRMMKFLN